jgi:AcrR family transcriptional regulator
MLVPPRAATKASLAAAKPALSAALIVQTALAQMRTRGYEGVTMRSIAHSLDTGPASLYAHVANRHALDELLVEAVLAGVETPERTDWREAVREMLRSLLAAYQAYPGVARAALGDLPANSQSLRITEYLLEQVLRSNAEPARAVWAVNFLLLHVSSFALVQDLSAASTSSGPAQKSSPEALETFFQSLPDAFPALRANAKVIAECDTSQWFDLGLGLVLDCIDLSALEVDASEQGAAPGPDTSRDTGR